MLSMLEQISMHILEGDFYRALKLAKRLIGYEDGLLRDAEAALTGHAARETKPAAGTRERRVYSAQHPAPGPESLARHLPG